ncbi:cupin domain-containing protein [Rhodococcus jostii]|uniref:Cupin type-2 domain-containing protein n=1 Tax=Rhodococcus jostii TaxID=132919 RepID=A0A1H5IMH2_RHOJO|nr:cupin domain-containing protein [Rhodococcus jostii]SEE40698.1 hypothetical protein SAMN04490220_7701 [Rhodococcus jostii]
MSTNVHVVRAGDGRRLTVPDADITVLVGGGHAGGAYEMFLVEAPRGAPAPLHSEPWSKSYHVLRGRILVQAGDTGYELAPGETIVIEAGTMNTFTALSESADFLLVVAGASNSGFFAELDAVGHGHAPEEVARLLHEAADRYGVALGTGAGAS